MNVKCDVCGDFSSGIYFGGKSCRACKDFFWRSNKNLKEKKQLKHSSQSCYTNTCNTKYIFVKLFKILIYKLKNKVFPQWMLITEVSVNTVGI